MSVTSPTRRAFMGSAAVAAISAPSLATQARADGHGEGFTFEVTRSEEEWRAMLTDEEYRIMREGGTEPRYSSETWDEDRPGSYRCKGCDLELYTGDYKRLLFIGWVFWEHAIPDTVLMGIDTLPEEYGGADEMAETRTLIEAHCRRCGSHLGHIVSIEGDVLHCINGAALNYTPAEA